MKRLLLSVAALAMVVAGGAEAQVQAPGFYATGFGQFVMPSDPNYRVGVLAPSKTNPGYGGGGGLQVGWGFGGGWDVGAGGRLVVIGEGDPITVFNGRDNAYYIAGDLNAGYTMLLNPNASLRGGLGLRYVFWKHSYSENAADMQERYNGIGPRATLDLAYRVSDGWLLVAGLGGGPFFGSTNSTTSAVFPAPSGSRTVWALDGLVGVGYDFGMMNVVVGWKGEHWWNLHSSQFGSAAGGESRFVHGPYLRVSYNWGAPPTGPLPIPPPEDVKQVSYMVFFDFDRSTITPPAAATIQQAAASAKAGNKTRIGVTGHADRSGSDAYNMALSLRRAGAVKDALVAQGIPASEITVVGRGESQPLVQTPDGVREPQNRRVEIVLQ